MRKKIIFIATLLLAVLILSGAACAKKEAGEGGAVPLGEQAGKKTESLADILGKAKGVASFKYDMTITAPGQAAEIVQKMWLKEKKMRMEGNFDGRDMVYLVDTDEQTAYIFMPAENTAMKISLSQAQGTAGESPTEQSGSIMQYNPVTAGTEVIDGKNCLVVEYTAGIGKTKMWLWTKYGFPIKTETATTEGTTVVEVKNIEFGDIPDSMFELPAGVQLMQIPSFGF